MIFTLMFTTACVLVQLTNDTFASTPTESVRTTVDAVLSTIKDRDLSKADKKEERRAKIKSLISDRFDFEEMSQRSLARHWEPRTPEEKKEFVRLFSELLEESYVSKIESYTDEKINYDKEAIKGDGKYSAVSTEIITKNVNIPIEYKLIIKGDKWWVYDVTIEGVSFISTYREQYNKIIMKESFASLISKMKSKLEEIKTLEAKETSVRK